MDNISINVESIVTETEKIKKEKKNLEDVLNNLYKQTDALKEYWQTRTSDEVFSSFSDFKKHFENVINYLSNDIDFLEKTVKASYETNEELTNKEIDSNITI